MEFAKTCRSKRRLRGLSINTAQILGVGDRPGLMEKGEVAELMLTTAIRWNEDEYQADVHHGERSERGIMARARV
jgi:hypothetical protein